MKSKNKDSDYCQMNYCRSIATLTYLEVPMCQSCWNKRCNEEDQQEQSQLKKCTNPTTD